MKAQVFQKLKEINPTRDLTLIVRAAASDSTTSDLLRPYFRIYPGMDVLLTGREISPKVALTLERNAASEGSRFSFKPPAAPESAPGLAGLCASLKQCNTKYFVMTDASASHPSELIEDLIRELDYGADLAVCSRVAAGAFERSSAYLIRQLRASVARIGLKRSAVPVRDPYSNYFAGRTSSILSILNQIGTSGYGRKDQALVDLLQGAGRKLRVAEVNYLPAA